MASCYTRNNNNVDDVTGWNEPCSNATGVQLCCAVNSICGEDGFCHFTHQMSQPVSGYYMGGCADATFTDRTCPQHCTEYPTQGVVYNSTSGLWACCYGSGVLDCRYPSNETFFAPRPEKLFSSIPLPSVLFRPPHKHLQYIPPSTRAPEHRLPQNLQEHTTTHMD